MQPLQRTGTRCISRLNQVPSRQPSTGSIRLASSTASPSNPKAESFGKGFYLTITALPTAYVVYSLSTGDTSNNFIVRAVNAYSDTKAEWAERNALHTKMVEQAGHDRNLFLNTTSAKVVDLKFPEVFNASSPYNVPAGQSSINLESLIAHYQDKAFKEEEEKLRLMKEGKLPIQLEQAKLSGSSAALAGKEEKP